MEYTYKYPRPAVTVDALIFSNDENDVQVLLIKRKNDPYKGNWAIPGGFLDENETLEHAVLRELEEETEISGIDFKQFKAYSAPKRDPRGRTISVVFTSVIDYKPVANAADDASELAWFSISELPKLAFDHDVIINEAKKAILSL